MPPQRKGITRPLSLVDAKCNTEQLTGKSCPSEHRDFISTHMTNSSQPQCRVSTPSMWGEPARRSLRTIPAAELRASRALLGNFLCLMWSAEGMVYKGLCSTPLGSFQKKNSIMPLTPGGQCQNHTPINPSSTTIKSPPDLRSKQVLQADFWGPLRQHNTTIKAHELKFFLFIFN